MCQPGGEVFVGPYCGRVGGGKGHDIAGTALEHGYVRCFLGEVWKEGYGCCAGSDDRDSFVGVI